MKRSAIEKGVSTSHRAWFERWPFRVQGEDALGWRQVQILVILSVVLCGAFVLGRISPIYLRWTLLGGVAGAAVLNRFGWYRLTSVVIVLSIWITPYLGFAETPLTLEYQLLSSFMWQTLAIFLSSVLFERRELLLLIMSNFLLMLLVPIVYGGVTYQNMRVSFEFIGITSLFFWLVTYQRDLLQEERRQRIEQSEEKFYKAFQNTSVGVAIQRRLDHRYLEVNDAFAKMTGWKKVDFIGKRPEDFGLWANVTVRDQLRQQYAESGRLPETEIHFYDLKGAIHTGLLTVETAEINGETCMLSTLQDITMRVAAEKALMRSQERFQILADNLPGAVYLCLNDDVYTPLYLNEKIEAVTGHNKQAFLERRVTFADLYHPEDVPFISDRVDTALRKKQSYHLFYRMRHKDGRWRWIEEVGRGVDDGGMWHLEGFLQDITERREAEMALARQASQMTSLYDLSLLLNRELELEKLAQIVVERAVALLNAEMSTLVLKDARTGQQVLYSTFNMSEPITPLSPHTKRGTTYHVLQTGQPLQIENYSEWDHRIKTHPWNKLGRILSVPLAYNTEMIGVISVFDYYPGRFTVEQQQLFTLFATYVTVAVQNAHFFRNEQRQREVAEALREAGRAVNSTLALTDILDFILTEAKKVIDHDVAHIMLVEDDRHLRMISAEDFTSDEPHPLLGEQIPLAELPLSMKVLNEQQPLLVENTDLEASFKGSYRASENAQSLIMLPLISQNKSIGLLTMVSRHRYFFVLDDLEIGRQFTPYLVNAIVNARLLMQTQKYNAELKMRVAERTSELVIAKNEAERANLAKSVFLANMGHELRTPMTAILGFARILLQRDSLTKDEQEYLQIIDYSGRHLLMLINDVLDMAKIEAGKLTLEPQPFDLSQFLVLTEGMFHLPAADKGVELQTIYNGPRPCYVLADRRKLSQILINLLSNAMKFTDEGYVYLKVEVTQTAAALLQVKFMIEDSGIGIDQESTERLFEPFTQLAQHKFQEGSGLGLAISQEYVRLMGGEIQVDTAVDEGSTFFFTLVFPVVEPADLPVGRVSPTVVGLQPDQPEQRILIVQRAKENGLLLRALLSPVGFKTRVIKDAADLKLMCERWQPHAIFIDYRILLQDSLSNSDFGLSSVLSKSILIVTHSSNLGSLRSEQLPYHIDGFVQRPFREKEIFETLRKFLNVNYITTEELGAHTGSETVLRRHSTEIDLTVLPETWLHQMYSAAVMSDQQQMKILIGQIQSMYPHIAEYMTHLVGTFATRRLIDITSASLKRYE